MAKSKATKPKPKTPKTAKPKAKRGRPSKYDKLDMEKVKKLALKGFTDKDMSDFFGVDQKTWDNWKKAHTDFFQSLKDWKVEYDGRVEHSLAERALGYSHPEDKIFNDNGTPLIVKTIKHYPPDTTACIFWLKNRQPKQWRDVHDFKTDAVKIKIVTV